MKSRFSALDKFGALDKFAKGKLTEEEYKKYLEAKKMLIKRKMDDDDIEEILGAYIWGCYGYYDH